MPTLPVDQVGRDLGRAGAGRVALRAAVEPVDDGHGAERLVRRARGGAAVGVARARRLGVHDGEAARHPGGLVDRADARARVARVEVRCALMRAAGDGAELVVDRPVGRSAAAGVVRAVLEDHGDLQAVRVRLHRPRHVDVDAIRLAVVVAVEVRLDPQLVVDPVRLAGREDGLRHAVDERRDRGRRLRRGRSNRRLRGLRRLRRQRRRGRRAHERRHGDRGRKRARLREALSKFHP